MKKEEKDSRITYPSQEPQSFTFQDLKGYLIVFEGMDGSGKTTQISKLMDYLLHKKIDSYKTNFLRLVFTKDITSVAKWKNCNPLTRSLIDTLALYEEIMSNVISRLREGKIVILDRYLYTIMSRYSVRGIDEPWLRSLLSLLPKPDIVFYVKTRVETCLARKNGEMLSYWECGCDIYGDDPFVRECYSEKEYSSSFIKYQTIVEEKLRGFLPSDITFVLNGESEETDIHEEIISELRCRNILM